MRLISRAARGISKLRMLLDLYANWISAGCIIFLMLFISTDVTTRYLAARPIPGSFEIGQILLTVIVFLALAQTQAERGHLRVEVVTSRLPVKARAIMDIIAYLAGILLYGLIVWKTSRWAWESWELKEYAAGTINVPLYPAKFAMVAGCGLFCLRFIYDIAQRIRELKRSV